VVENVSISKPCLVLIIRRETFADLDGKRAARRAAPAFIVQMIESMSKSENNNFGRELENQYSRPETWPRALRSEIFSALPFIEQTNLEFFTVYLRDRN